MIDLERSLRGYGEQLETSVEPFEIGDLIEGRPVRLRPARVRANRGLAVAAAAALAVIGLIGGVLALLTMGSGPDTPPVTNAPTVTTAIPAPTTLAPTLETSPPPAAVAVQDPAPPPTSAPPPPEPTLAPIPPQPVIGVDVTRWAQVPITGGAFIPGDSISDVIAGGPGFIAVGFNFAADERSDAAVWTSPDATEWSRVPHDEALFGTGSAQMYQILRLRDRYVAIGATCDDPAGACPGHPRMWLSPDGLSWSRAPWDPAVFGTHVGINAASATEEELFAFGHVCRVDGVEFSAEDRALFATNTTEDCLFVAWSSPDGSTWERIYFDDDPLVSVSAITTGGPGFVAVGEAWDDSINDNRPAAWTSTDGRTWTRADTPDDRAGLINWVVATDNGFVGAGWLRGQDRNRHLQTAMWFSSDGASWSLVHDEGADSDVLALVLGGPGLIVGGAEAATNPAESQGAIWTSPDGLSWTRITGPESGLPAGFVDQIVAVGDRVFILVKNPNGELVGIWTAPT